ncbi:MAG TPA: OmpA family protein [Cyclobacteriaceae bacterium]|nr:OmpA family protein [Cyclobacteriaceae bacterium]
MLRYLIISISISYVFSANAQQLNTREDSINYYNSTKRLVTGLSEGENITYSPTISADGRTMIFQSSVPGGTYKLYESRLNNNGEWGKPIPLDNINNYGDSTSFIAGPNLSFDGNTLYFFAAFKLGEAEDIYYSVRQNNSWSEPINIGSVINTTGYEGFPSISADGKTLYFVRANAQGPQDRDLRRQAAFCTSIFISEKDSQGNWTSAKRLPFPINQDCEKAPRIMADGRTLIFSSNRPGGMGDYDMYQSTKNVLGEWTFPRPLDYVNTPLSDQLPSIDARGELMYYTFNNQSIYSIVIPPHLRQFVNNIIQGFITDQDTNKGIAAEILVTDAFTSELVMKIDNNPSDGRYTIVLPAGRRFNIEIKKAGYSSYSEAFDLRSVKQYQETRRDVKLFKSIDLTVGVSDKEIFEAIPADVKVKVFGQNQFIRETKSDARTGLARLALPIGEKYEVIVSAANFKSEIFTLDASGLVLYRNFDKEVELQPEKTGVMINVADLVNDSKVKSKIVLRNKDRDEIIEVNGNEMVQLRVGDRYELEATSDQGYAFSSTLINVDGAATAEVEIKLQKLERDSKLALRDITFESNSAQLSEVSFTELQRVVKLMLENPSLKVEISAHTDDVGADAYNLVLSNKRAQSVLNYLVDQNVPKERFTFRGYGKAQPKVPNNSEENRAINRRVELKILTI